MQTKEFIVKKPSEFTKVIDYILEYNTATATKPTVQMICLSGDLGAGKTTFTQQLASYLGVTNHVTSPTFGIMKSYQVSDHPQFDQLVHIDAYRIEDISEIDPLRLQEVFIQPRTIICLEWPKHISAALPAERVEVQIEIKENEVRIVTVRDSFA